MEIAELKKESIEDTNSKNIVGGEIMKLEDMPLGSIVELETTDEGKESQKCYNKGTIIAKGGDGWITLGFKTQQGSSWTTEYNFSNVGYPHNVVQLWADEKSLKQKFKYARNISGTGRIIGTNTLSKEDSEKINPENNELKNISTLPYGGVVEFSTGHDGDYSGGVILGKRKDGGVLLGFENKRGNAWVINDTSAEGFETIISIDSIKHKYKYGRYVWTDAKVIGNVNLADIEKEYEEFKKSVEKEKFEEFEVNIIDDKKSIENGVITIEAKVLDLSKVQSIIGIGPILLNTNNTQESNTNKPSLKEEAKEAAFRIAAHQLIKGLKHYIVEYMEKSGHKNIKALGEMLDTEYGSMLLSLVIGYSLTASQIKDKKIQKLAEEFRVSAIVRAGNSLFDNIIEQMTPIVKQSISNISQQEQEKEIRVALPETSKEIVENKNLDEEISLSNDKTLFN